MNDLAFHLFRYVNERIHEGAHRLEIYVVENGAEGKLELMVKDNGTKFSAEKQTKDQPAYSRSLLFFEKNTKQYKGNFQILSHKQTGNLVQLSYPLANCPPLGDVSSYLSMLFVTQPNHQFIFSYIGLQSEFTFDSQMLRNQFTEEDIEGAEFLQNLNQLIKDETAAVSRLR